MNKLMHIGTILTVITVALVIGAFAWAILSGGLQETRESIRETSDSIPQGEVDLRRQGQFYTETFQVFLMDSELDEGECDTLRDLAEPLADRIADPGGADLDYAEHLAEVIDSVENVCQ